MFSQLNILLDHLSQSDFLLLVLEPMFMYGLLFGLIVFIVGYSMSDARARTTGLIIIAVACFTTYPYLELANKATPRIASMTGLWQNGAVKEQTKRRVDTRWVFYGLGLLALAALSSGGGVNNYLGGTTIAVGIGVLFFSLWLHMKECEIYHPYIKHKTYGR